MPYESDKTRQKFSFARIELHESHSLSAFPTLAYASDVEWYLKSIMNDFGDFAFDFCSMKMELIFV